MLTDEILWELKREEITFDEFATRHRIDFERLSAKAVRAHGSLPVMIGLDDLVQEMLLTVVRQLPNHDANKSSIKKFIVFEVCTTARRAIASATRSKGRDDLMELVDDVQQADQDVRVEEMQRLNNLFEVLPHGERQDVILRSLAQTQSFQATARALLEDPATRHMFAPLASRTVKRVSTHTWKCTHRSITRSAHKMAQRAQAMA